MLKNLKMLSSALVATLLALVGFTVRKYYHQIYERFPQYDRKVLRKAYRRLVWDSFRGKYHSIPMHTDEQIDELFLKTVADMTTPK